MVSEANGEAQGAQELETFLPHDEKKKGVVISVQEKKSTDHDLEAEFDPFADRNQAHATSDMDTLTHLLKASLGTGILAMPRAFQKSGILAGIFFTILAATVCTHCSYILVKCSHVLYKKTKMTTMTFADVAEQSFKNGPLWARRFAYPFRLLVMISLFATYFGTCSVYTVIIATNIRQVTENLMGVAENYLDIHYFIAFLLLPLIPMVWIRNLKYLAPVSMIANVFMGAGLGITFYYLVKDPFDFSKKTLITHPSEWPEFFSITIFAMEAIGVVMPLENSMRTPRNMLGFCGVLNKGMTGVTMVYILLGFLGYARYEDLHGAVTLNLPVEEVPAKIVKIAVALAVYCTFALQFYVCIEIVWHGIKERYSKSPVLADYVMRTVLVTACVMLAVAVPTISPFIGLIGAFCFSILGLLSPIVIEIITFWDIGFGKCYYLIWKNILVGIFGAFALVFGTKEAISSIIQEYSKEDVFTNVTTGNITKW